MPFKCNRKVVLYSQSHVFEVGYGGNRYLIDGRYPYPELYKDTDVPYEVAEMANEAISSGFRDVGYVFNSQTDARDIMQKALETVFDDVKLVKDDYPYGAAF